MLCHREHGLSSTSEPKLVVAAFRVLSRVFSDFRRLFLVFSDFRRKRPKTRNKKPFRPKTDVVRNFFSLGNRRFLRFSGIAPPGIAPPRLARTSARAAPALPRRAQRARALADSGTTHFSSTSSHKSCVRLVTRLLALLSDRRLVRPSGRNAAGKEGSQVLTAELR